MAAGIIVVPSLFPARDRNGRLVAGALMGVYVNRTTTVATAYTDSSLSTPLANPVPANSSGVFPVVWAEAGDVEDPVLYTVAISGPGGASIANPSVFHDWQPSLDADVALLALAEAAQISAAADAAQTAQDLADIQDIAANAPEAPSIANKVNLDGGNIPDQPAFRASVGLIDYTYLEDISGVVAGSGGDGAVNAAALTEWMADNPGKILRLRNAELYNMGHVVVPSGSRIIADTAQTPIINLPSTIFTNTNPTTKFGTNVVGFEMSGETSGSYTPNDDILLEGFRFQYDGPDGRQIRMIRASNMKNLVLRGLQFEGLGVGRAIYANSLIGDWSIEDCRFTDFNPAADLGAGSQTTCIELDDDRVNSVGSIGGRILNNYAKNIEFTGALLAARSHQSDFIFIGVEARGISVANNFVNGVGEALDCYGDHISVTNMQVENASLFGIKFANGAQRCRVSGGYVKNFGRAGIVFSGTATRARDTAYNVVSNVSVEGGNYLGEFNASSAALLMEAPGGFTGNYVGNEVRSCRLDAGSATYAIRDDGVGVGNIAVGVTLVGGTTAKVAATAASLAISTAVQTIVLAVADANQSVTAGSTVAMVFGSETLDACTEYNPATGLFTASTPKTVRIRAQRRVDANNAGTTHEIGVRVNGTQLFVNVQAFAETSNLVVAIEKVVSLNIGDTLDVTFKNGDSVTRTLSSNGEVGFLEITEVPRVV